MTPPVEQQTTRAIALDARRPLERMDDARRRYRAIPKAVPHRRGWLIRRALLAADVLGLAFAFLLAEYIFGVPAADRIGVRTEYVLFLLTLPVWVLVAKIYGLYDRDEERADHSTADEIVHVIHLVTVGTWLLFAGASLSGLADPTLGKFATFWALAIALIGAARSGARSLCRRQVSYLQNTIIVGAGEVGQTVATKLIRRREYGLNLVGFVDSEPRELRPELGHIALLGAPGELRNFVELLDVERVVIAFSNESHEETLALIRDLKGTGVQVAIVPRLFELVGPGVGIHTVEGIPMLGLPALHLSHSSALVKRFFDLALVVPALLLLAPLFALIALLVRLDSPGPVFFRQVRRGSNGRNFHIVKFRTMSADAEEHKAELGHLNMHAGSDPRMFKIQDDPRITRIGVFLRRHSLDELPQLVNVLRGEMSLVGARPLVLDEDQHVDGWGRSRLDLKPGMTGLWQVLGGSDISFDEMVRLDYLYVTSWSVGNDLRLLWKTLPLVVRTSGSY